MNPDVIRGLSAPLDMPDEEDKSAFNKLKSQKPPSKRNGNKARAFFHNATQKKKKKEGAKWLFWATYSNDVVAGTETSGHFGPP